MSPNPAPSSPATTAWLLSGKSLIAVIFLLTIYRLFALSQGHVTPFYDEAYYYHWSLNPDWGYYSKPPMVAWVIAITTSLLGDTSFALKAGAPILYSLTALILYALAKRLWNPQAGAAAGLVFASATLVGFNSLFITTDAPLLFFWALSAWLFTLALFEGDSWRWVLAGLAVGLGMLSKYTMALLPIGLLLYMALTPQWRAQLATWKPWMAAIIAGLVFAPNIYWNYQHDFVTLSHTSDISQLDKKLFNPDKLAEFWVSQLLVLGPIWSYFLFRQWFSRSARQSMPYIGLILALFLPLFAVISTQALLSRAFINWAAPCIIALSLSVGFYLHQRASVKPLVIGATIQLLLLSLFYHWPTVLNTLNIEQSRKNTPYQRTEGWRELSLAVKPMLDANPSLVLASPSRKLLAYISFYATPGELRVASWNANPDYIEDYYDLFFNLRRYTNENKEFLLVNETSLPVSILSRFNSCETLPTQELAVFKDLTRSLYQYRCTGFKGYEAP